MSFFYFPSVCLFFLVVFSLFFYFPFKITIVVIKARAFVLSFYPPARRTGNAIMSVLQTWGRTPSQALMAFLSWTRFPSVPISMMRGSRPAETSSPVLRTGSTFPIQTDSTLLKVSTTSDNPSLFPPSPSLLLLFSTFFLCVCVCVYVSCHRRNRLLR